MNNNIKDITGVKFRFLTAIKFSHREGESTFWVYKCECGSEITLKSKEVKNGKRISCGCKSKYNKVINVKGVSTSGIAKSYYGMINRCYKKHIKEYKRYGFRGISVYDEWRNDFSAFYKWANENGWEEGLEIDRIDNDGNYEPNNCKWSTGIQQANNTSHTIYITYNGETLSMYEWSLRTGTPRMIIKKRYISGKLSTHDVLYNKRYYNLPAGCR